MRNCFYDRNTKQMCLLCLAIVYLIMINYYIIVSHVLYLYLLGSSCRTCKEFSFDGLYICRFSTESNSWVFRRMGYGKFRRNQSICYKRVRTFPATLLFLFLVLRINLKLHCLCTWPCVSFCLIKLLILFCGKSSSFFMLPNDNLSFF